MTRFTIELWMDGYETEEEHDAACKQFIVEQLDFSGSSVEFIVEEEND